MSRRWASAGGTRGDRVSIRPSYSPVGMSKISWAWGSICMIPVSRSQSKLPIRLSARIGSGWAGQSSGSDRALAPRSTMGHTLPGIGQIFDFLSRPKCERIELPATGPGHPISEDVTQRHNGKEGSWRDGVVHRPRVLDEPAGLPAGAGRRVPLRLPERGAAVPCADRRAGHAARAPFRRPGAVPAGTERVPPPLLGPFLRSLGLDRLRGLGRPHRGPGRSTAALGRHAAVARPLGDVSVDRERRPDLVLLRLGVPAPGGRLPRRLPGQRRGRPADRGALPAALDPLPPRVRGRSDQNARRRLLAEADLPRLPPRDPADAGPAELVLPPSPEALPPGGGGGQPLHPARRPRPPLRPSAHRDGRGVPDDRHPAVAGPVGQLRLAELDHDRSRAVGRGLRSDAGTVCCSALVRDRGPGRRRRTGRPQLPSGPQSGLPPPGHEPLLRPAPPRKHLRGVRQRQPPEVRGGPRGHAGRGAARGLRLAGVRVQGQAG